MYSPWEKDMNLGDQKWNAMDRIVPPTNSYIDFIYIYIYIHIHSYIIPHVTIFGEWAFKG